MALPQPPVEQRQVQQAIDVGVIDYAEFLNPFGVQPFSASHDAAGDIPPRSPGHGKGEGTPLSLRTGDERVRPRPANAIKRRIDKPTIESAVDRALAHSTVGPVDKALAAGTAVGGN